MVSCSNVHICMLPDSDTSSLFNISLIALVLRGKISEKRSISLLFCVCLIACFIFCVSLFILCLCKNEMFG